MRTTSRLIRTVLVAAGLLAISASAAQAMPTRQSTDAGKNLGFAATGHPGGPSLNRSGIGDSGRLVVATSAHDPLGAATAVQVLHRSGFVLGHQLNFVPAQPMAAAVDSPTTQVISQPVPATFHALGFVRQLNLAPAQSVSAQSAATGFDWADAAVGAFVASLVLILAAIAATIVRPRQTLQL
jgi:hypothetical protein